MRQRLSKLSNLVSSQPWLTKRNLWTGWVVGSLTVGAVGAIVYNIQTGNLKTGIASDETVTISEKRDKQGTVIETTTTKTQQDAKTLWDWLSLLGVPVSLAILGYGLQQLQQTRADQQAKVEKEIAEFNQREEALQNYLDRLSELLIDKNLIATAVKLQFETENQTEESQPDQAIVEQQELLNAAKDVIRARTLSILRRLENDGERKGDVIRFLIEAEVISKLKLNLSRANLSGANLSGVNLSSANLKFANLSKTELIGINLGDADLAGTNFKDADLRFADFRFANLIGANFHRTNLSRAMLVGANFDNANFSGANFKNANLSRANFSNANLSRANLSRADIVTDEQLAVAKLCNTILPAGSGLDPNRDCKELELRFLQLDELL